MAGVSAPGLGATGIAAAPGAAVPPAAGASGAPGSAVPPAAGASGAPGSAAPPAAAAPGAPGEAAPPAGLRLVLDAGVRRLDGGRVLLGGVPLRLLRLTPAGAALVARWTAGAPVGERPAAGALARRLLASGIAHPVPGDGGPGLDAVALVVPARDRADALGRCLAAAGAAAERLVVDDGSEDPAAIAAAAAAHGWRVVRRERAGGPAAARNAGLAATSAPFVAFVDSDCEPHDGWLPPLLGHFADPVVAAVAPRVTNLHDGSALGRYDAARGPLDLGPHPGAVAPGRPVAYVPAAALVVRRRAADPGFEEALRFGEDVDFVWRLARAGWTVRYEPAVRVGHAHRTTVRAWLGQRLAYGSSAAALARRHPQRLAHVELSWSALPWLLAAAARPRAAAGAALTGAVVVGVRLRGVGVGPRGGVRPHGTGETPGAGARGGTPRVEARRGGTAGVALTLSASAYRHAGRQLAAALWRAYSPLALPLALRSRRVRGAVALAAVVPAALEWGERRPRLDPVRYLVLRAGEDLAYAAGLWSGCLRERTFAPLVPRLTGLGRRRG